MPNATLAPVLQHIRTLVEAGNREEASDAQLLERFLTARDEAAFAALVRRHGPMVLSVARHVLRRLQDAEDIFQATFLLLARKASAIRKRDSVSSWLHGVAYRLALRARGQGACRERHEQRAITMRKTAPQLATACRELYATLHEELERLP